MKKLKGTIALIPTPLTDEGKVDEKGLRKLIDFDMQKGCDGIGVLAAIGEGYLFGENEQEQIVRTAVDAIGDRGPLIVGCPAMSTVGAVEACKRAQDWGADAILAFDLNLQPVDAAIARYDVDVNGNMELADAILGVRLYQQAESFRDGEIEQTQKFLRQKGLPDDFLAQIPPLRTVDQTQRSIDQIQALVCR